jgi:hypothetical protein
MVPIDPFERPDPKRAKKVWVPPKRRPREPTPPEPRAPRRFRIVDVLSRQVLQEDGGVRETLELLAGIDRMHDVSLSIWEPREERWRLLGITETRAVWDRSRSSRSG